MLATIEAAGASAAIKAAIKEFEIQDEARQKRLFAVRRASTCPLVPNPDTHYHMSESVSGSLKNYGTPKKRGRQKTTGRGAQIGMRWQKSILDAVDAWRAKQRDNPSRPDAIRRLVEQALVLSEIDAWCAKQQGSRPEAIRWLVERALASASGR
jgi:hypothetical protein